MAFPGWLTALLGVSAYQRLPNSALPTLDSPQVVAVREALGGQLAPPPMSQTRWYLSDLEAAEYAADTGDISSAARLMRAARKDGTLSGVLSTRTSGLVRLPKKFSGAPEVVANLEAGHDATSGVSVRSVFDDLHPPSELALLAADGELLGVGVAERVPVRGRAYPVLVRLEPEFLYYRWSENRWYYKAVAGLIPITPGDGRWVLHTPGGRLAPWQHGLWRGVGRAYIRKEHANLHKDNWEAKLANPARVAVSPQGGSEEQKQSFWRQVMAWGVNTVFGLTPGYDVKLLESNGRGYDSFVKTIAEQNQEFIIAVAGQTVTTDGGAGFSNSDIHRTIRADLIKATADSLAYTLNTQSIPHYIATVFPSSFNRGAIVEWDVKPPKDLTAEAASMNGVATAIKTLTEALKEHGRELDINAMCAKFGVPVLGDVDGDGRPDEEQDEDEDDEQDETETPNLRLVENVA